MSTVLGTLSTLHTPHIRLLAPGPQYEDVRRSLSSDLRQIPLFSVLVKRKGRWLCNQGDPVPP